MDILTNPAVLGWVAVLTAVALAWASRAKPEIAKYEGVVVGLFNQIEKQIPDNSQGRFNKLDLFLKRFIEEYVRRTGKKPGENVLRDAADLVEKLVYKNNAR